MRDLVEQLKGAIEQMTLQQRDYEELHLSKDECEYLLLLLAKENLK